TVLVRWPLAPLALDLHAGGFGVGDGFGFLDAHAGLEHARVLKADRGDLLGQGLDQMYVTAQRMRADAVDQGAVVHDGAEIVIVGRRIQHRKIEVDPHLLRAALFAMIDADMHREFEVAHDDAAGLAHSCTSTSGVAQAMCWPPSTAIISPVTE